MRESNQTKVPRSSTLTMVTTKFTLFTLVKKNGAETQSGIEWLNARQFPWRTVAVYIAHPQDFSTCMRFLLAAVEA